MNQLLSFVNFLFCICHDQAMEVFFLVAGVSCIRSTLAFLDRAFSTNGDLCTRFCFHFLQGIATWSDEESNFSTRKKLSVSLCIIKEGHDFKQLMLVLGQNWKYRLSRHKCITVRWVHRKANKENNGR